MRRKPQEGGRGTNEAWDAAEKENAELLKTEWWKEISTEKIPFCPRPKGGARIDFFAYSNFPDMALEIKESYYGFKHTGDVHRTAHYIGMYLLREKYVKNKKEHDLDNFINASEEEMSRGFQRKRMQEQFMICFDQFIDSVQTDDEFKKAITKMKAAITNEDTKKWFETMVSAVMNDETEINKSKNRQRMRLVRAKVAGLKLVGENDPDSVAM
jgi:hypothetical protein